MEQVEELRRDQAARQNPGFCLAAARQRLDERPLAIRRAALAATLEKINYIYLRDEKAHQKLADLDMELGNPTEAIQEYNAVLALKPVDPAGTHYSLAKAYQAVHKNSDAMDEVLSSLEIAPGFRDAQKLLLELNKESSK